MKWKEKLGIDGFLIGLLLAVLLAWVYPHGGATGGWMHPKLVNGVGVALVFFLGGAKLPSEVLRSGISRWKVHVLIQAITYLAFPLLGIVLLALARPSLGEPLAIGLFFLCALPSTVTSSVALISAAEGDVPLGIFNATLSTTLGVVLTPVWLTWAISAAGRSVDLLGALSGLLLLVVGPLVVGHLLRGRLQWFLKRFATPIKYIDRLVILILVHTSFCSSFKNDLWSSHNPLHLASIIGLALVVFLLMSGFCSASASLLGLEDRAKKAVVFCGSQKSLAVGIPMSQVLFPDTADVGLLLLPLMIYHPLQLVVSGVFVQHWTRPLSESTAT